MRPFDYNGSFRSVYWELGHHCCYYSLVLISKHLNDNNFYYVRDRAASVLGTNYAATFIPFYYVAK